MSVCREMRSEGMGRGRGVRGWGVCMSMCPREYSCECVLLCVKHSHVNPVLGIFMRSISKCLGSMSCNPPYGCVSLCVLDVGVPLPPCGYLYLYVSVCPSVCVQACLSN